MKYPRQNMLEVLYRALRRTEEIDLKALGPDGESGFAAGLKQMILAVVRGEQIELYGDIND